MELTRRRHQEELESLKLDIEEQAKRQVERQTRKKIEEERAKLEAEAEVGYGIFSNFYDIYRKEILLCKQWRTVTKCHPPTRCYIIFSMLFNKSHFANILLT